MARRPFHFSAKGVKGPTERESGFSPALHQPILIHMQHALEECTVQVRAYPQQQESKAAKSSLFPGQQLRASSLPTQGKWQDAAQGGYMENSGAVPAQVRRVIADLSRPGNAW